METNNPESKTYFEAFLLFFISPKIAFQIVIEKSEKIPQLILLGLYGLINVISPILIYEELVGEVIIMLVFGGLMGVAGGWVGIWLLSQLTNLLNNLLGGDSESDDIFTVFSFSLLPIIIFLIINTILGIIVGPKEVFQITSGFLILIGFGWTCVLAYIGNRETSKNNWIKNLISISIPLIVIILVKILPATLQR